MHTYRMYNYYMKIALVCDDLIQFGGQERLILALHELWPDAPIFTSVVSEKWKKICEEKKILLKVSFMQKLPWIEKLNRFYSVFLFHQLAFESFDFTGYDVILSVSARYSHCIITKPQTIHICYMNSPGRMIWEPHLYFRKENFGVLRYFSKIFLSFPLSLLRAGDYSSAQGVDYFIANSLTSKNRIKKYYGRDSIVIHPFADIKPFENTDSGNFFLVISRLNAWKRIDTAVEACTRLKIPLRVIGTGPDLIRLKRIAGDTVEFLGYVREEVKSEMLGKCTALINTQEEDFGIVPVEAMAHGKPVIAYGNGGVCETVEPGITGEFYYEQTADSLMEVLEFFDSKKYDPDICKKSAERFTKYEFLTSVQRYVNEVYFSRRN